MAGLSVTYLCIWTLGFSPRQQPDIDAAPLEIILAIQRPNISVPTEQPTEQLPEEPKEQPKEQLPEQPTSESVLQPMPVKTVESPFIVPKVRAPIPFAAQKRAPLQPNTQPTEAVAAASKSTPVANTPQQPITPELPGMEPVPVSRLTRTPTFVHKELPNDPEDVQIPPGGVRVIARITLDETAVVTNVQIDKSGDVPFDVAVIAAIHRSRFTPGYIGDHAVATVFNQTYRFELQ